MQTASTAPEIHCIMVEPFMVDAMWEKCLPFIENPELGDIEYMSPGELKQECLAGYAQLWILMLGDDLVGCFCTNFGEASSTVKVCNIFNLAGSGAKLWSKALDEKIAGFAQSHGCSAYMCVTRKGFARLVPELKEAGALFVRKL